MPIYSYRCRQCGLIEDHVVSYVDRDKFMQHDGPYECSRNYRDKCGGSLERVEGLELPTLGKPSFQTQAVLANGDHIAGHFGKEAVRRKRKGS